MPGMFEAWDARSATDAPRPNTLDALFAKPERAPRPPVTVTAADRGRLAGYAAAALRSAADDVATAAQGTRNDTLNSVALRMHRMAAAGWIDSDLVDQVLGDADGGADHPATSRTLRSARESAERYGPAEPPVEHVTDDPFGDGVYTGPTGLASVHPLHPEPATLTGQPVNSPATETARLAIRAQPIDWRALWADDSREEWIIEPILPARRAVTIYSAPKVGKSLLALELAVGVARGARVLGALPDRPRRVLYVDFENDPRGDVRARLQAMQVGPDDLDQLVYLSYPDFAAFDTDLGGAQLLHAATEHDCDVVVIDTMSRSVEGPENDNDTWLRFYTRTGLRMKQAGITLLRLDHTGKDETRGQRGASAKSGDVDAVWFLSRINDDTYRLECTDHRMMIAPQDKTLVLHRRTDPLRHVVDGRGYLAALDTEVTDRIAVLDEAGTPVDAGRDQVRAALTEAWAGTDRRPGRNELLARVIAERQRRGRHTVSDLSPIAGTGDLDEPVRDRPGTAWDSATGQTTQPP